MKVVLTVRHEINFYTYVLLITFNLPRDKTDVCLLSRNLANPHLVPLIPKVISNIADPIAQSV